MTPFGLWMDPRFGVMVGGRKELPGKKSIFTAPSLLDMSEFVSSLPGGWTNIFPLSHSLSIGDEPSLCCACPRICS